MLSQIKVNNTVVADVDNEPIIDSENLVKSGGTKSTILPIDIIQNTFSIIPNNEFNYFIGYYDVYNGSKHEEYVKTYEFKTSDKISFGYFEYFLKNFSNYQFISSTTPYFYFYDIDKYRGFSTYNPESEQFVYYKPGQLEEYTENIEELGVINNFAITIPTKYTSWDILKSPIEQYLNDETQSVDRNVFELGLKYIKEGFDFEWRAGYIVYNTGIYEDYNIFKTTSTLFPKELMGLLYKARIEDMEYLPSSPDGYYSLYKDDRYVGAYGRFIIDDEVTITYRTPDGSFVENIDYDYFYITIYVQNGYNKNYLKNIRVISYLYDYEYSQEKYKKINKDYYALGDSITLGAYADNVSYADWLNEEIEFKSYTKLAISGSTCMKNTVHPQLYLYREVEQLPQNTDGIITVMIGVNDVAVQSPLGSVSEAMSIDFSNLDDETTFANAFRYNMESIQRKCPNAVLLCLLPIKTKVTSSYPLLNEDSMNNIRDIEKGICYALSIPYIETHLCGFSQYCNWDMFMNDGCHPIEAGHKRICQFLSGKLLQYK